jgi:ketosteroid isomerase-like protein
MTHAREEIEAVLERYLQFRRDVDAGRADWADLAAFFTEDAVFIDPAWGRVEGLPAITRFFADSMAGLEDWTFPVEFVAIEGDTVVVKWTQILPGTKPDGSQYRQSGVSTIVYAGDGKFCYEEDLLNMVHVFEDLKASGWRPSGAMHAPPAEPIRDFSRPVTAR